MKKQPFNLKINFTPNRILALMAGFFLLISIGTGVFLIPKILSTRDNIEKETAEVQILKDKAVVLDRLASDLRLLDQDSAVFTNALPKLIDIPNFMGRVSRVATDSGVLISSFQMTAGSSQRSQKDVRSSKAVNFSLSVQGPYVSTVTFIKNLENFAGILGFSSLEIKQAANQSNFKEVLSDFPEVDLSLQAYFLPQDEKDLPISSKIDFILENDNYKNLLNKAKQMVYWEAEEYLDRVGKINPFVR